MSDLQFLDPSPQTHHRKPLLHVLNAFVMITMQVTVMFALNKFGFQDNTLFGQLFNFGVFNKTDLAAAAGCGDQKALV